MVNPCSSIRHTNPKIQDQNHELRQSAADGKIANIERLLKNNNININEAGPITGNTALHNACKYDRLEIAKLLIENGADIFIKNKNHKICFELAKPESETYKFFYIFKERGVNVLDEKGNTALHIASFYKRAESARLLINAGVDSNIRNYDGETALHLASGNGSIEIVELLIKAKANLDIKNKAGETAIDIAYSKGFTEIVKLLSKYSLNYIDL